MHLSLMKVADFTWGTHFNFSWPEYVVLFTGSKVRRIKSSSYKLCVQKVACAI